MRIRTIKPEFWTDSKVVLLPIHTRLLFVGLWQMADDHGAFGDEPERIKMQIFPNDDVDVFESLEHLDSLGLIARCIDEHGKRLIYIPGFLRHQKIDKRAARRFSGGKWRKSAIPPELRRKIAEVYGASEGSKTMAECYYCGHPSRITVWRYRETCRPVISFGCLELDHFVPELDGGLTDRKNIVLACRSCNRKKGAYENGYSFAANRLATGKPILVNAYDDIDGADSNPYNTTPEPSKIPRRTTPHPAESRKAPPENGRESGGMVLEQGSGNRDHGSGNRDQGTMEQGSKGTDGAFAPRVRFEPPKREELDAEAETMGLPSIEVDKFVAYYASNGWKVGKNPMKSWKHALAGWAHRWKDNQAARSAPRLFDNRYGTDTPADAPF